MEFVKAENLAFSYEGAEKSTIHDINFSVSKGDFIIIAGKSGSGKSTLLKMMKPEIKPYGKMDGSIILNGKNLNDMTSKETAFTIGYVAQDVEGATATETVWSELAFGLESLGLDKETISGKIAEISNFFGISQWFRKKIETLSGGQKQIVNLAASMVTQPELLLLDEPTSMLDPIMRDTFFNLLKKINRELGVTVILVEHNLESIFFDADKIFLMLDGGTGIYDTPDNLINGDTLITSGINLPASVSLYFALNKVGQCPKSLVKARDYLVKYGKKSDIDFISAKDNSEKEVLISLHDAYFRYSKDGQDILRGLSFKLYRGEIVSIIGSNGVGKSTLLKCLAGIKPIYAGSYKLKGQRISKYRDKNISSIALLPQDPRGLFVEETVEDELKKFYKLIGMDKNQIDKELEDTLEFYNLSKLRKIHPYDISGGEAEKLAIAKVLAIKPEILLLDEPTQALDNNAKQQLRETLIKLKENGTTILMVTHDLDFSSQTATRCVTYFDGQLIGSASPVEFFSKKNIFTTDASRISRGFYKNAITLDSIREINK